MKKIILLAGVLLVCRLGFAGPEDGIYEVCFQSNHQIKSLPKTLCMEEASFVKGAKGDYIKVAGADLQGVYNIEHFDRTDSQHADVVGSKNILNVLDGACGDAEYADIEIDANVPLKGGKLDPRDLKVNIEYSHTEDKCHVKMQTQMIHFQRIN